MGQLQSTANAYINTSSRLLNPKNPPASLYHYTKLHALDKITRSHRLHATYNRDLNDKKEQVFAHNKITEALQRHLHGKPNAPVNVNSLVLPKHHFVTSFCQSKDIDEMWNEYADSSFGCCLEFDYKDLRHFGYRECVHYPALLPVSYGDISHDVDECIKATCQYWADTGCSLEKLTQHFGLFMSSMVKEAEQWQHEKEWRLIAVEPIDASVNAKPFIALNKMIGGEYIEQLPLKRVLFSPITETHGVKDQIADILKRNGYGDIPVESYWNPWRV